jgi:hypothetical protein
VDALKPTVVDTTTIALSYAVAASSAFPPLFPPIEVNHKTLITDVERFHPPQYLTDGGVYDNLGIDALLRLQDEYSDCDLLLTSDAEGNFDWSVDRPYRFIVGRNIRASDLLMHRVSQLQYRQLGTGAHEPLKIHLGMPVVHKTDPKVTDPASQRALKRIRTDLDAFSAKEISSLVYHRYAVAREVMMSAGVVRDEVRCEWSPVQEWSDRAPRWTADEVRGSETRKWRLWSWRDPATAATLLVCVAWLTLLAAPVYLQRVQVVMLQNLNLLIATRPPPSSQVVPDTIVRETNAYVRKSSATSVIVFVHGVFGDPIATWTCQTTGAFWPHMLTVDPAFDGYDVYLGKYTTSIRGPSLTVTEAASERERSRFVHDEDSRAACAII